MAPRRDGEAAKKEKIMRYRVNITKTREGYSIWVPGLPGCWSQGNTEKEALENIKDAIKGYMETARELCKKNQCRLIEVR